LCSISSVSWKGFSSASLSEETEKFPAEHLFPPSRGQIEKHAAESCPGT